MLLDGSLATTCKAMAAAGVPDAAVDALYMPSLVATDAYASRFSKVYSTGHRQHTAAAPQAVSAATPHVAYGSSGNAGRGEILTPATAALLAYDDAYDGEE